MDGSQEYAMVLDCGTATIKAGFSGRDMTSAIIQTVIGRPHEEEDYTLNGQQALKKQALVSLKYPIEHGVVVDWQSMERLYDHTFSNELRIDPKSQSLFMSESPLNPKKNLEKCFEIMFETFGLYSMETMSQSLLALYSTGS